MNLGVFDVMGESGGYIVKIALPSAGLHRSVVADRVLRRFGVEDTGARAETGRRAYQLVDEMLAAPQLADAATREKLLEARASQPARSRDEPQGWRRMAGRRRGRRPRTTEATHAELMKPHTMEELGRILAIDMLLGNFDRIRHSTPLQTAEAADRFARRRSHGTMRCAGTANSRREMPRRRWNRGTGERRRRAAAGPGPRACGRAGRGPRPDQAAPRGRAPEVGPEEEGLPPLVRVPTLRPGAEVDLEQPV